MGVIHQSFLNMFSRTTERLLTQVENEIKMLDSSYYISTVES